MVSFYKKSIPPALFALTGCFCMMGKKKDCCQTAVLYWFAWRSGEDSNLRTGYPV